MGLGKQAKALSQNQVKALLHHVGTLSNGTRNRVIVLLSVKAGLRAKEIASLRWSMVVAADGTIGDAIHLTNEASKGKSGRIIPMNRELKDALRELQQASQINEQASNYVIRTIRSEQMSAQAVVNLFRWWFGSLGFLGCSSHSGRRTFITNAARKISMIGGSLVDVQVLAGHSSLLTTQRYIESDSEVRTKIVNLI